MQYSIEDIRKVLFADLDTYTEADLSTDVANSYRIFEAFSNMMAQHLNAFVHFPKNYDVIEDRGLDYTNMADVKYLIGEILHKQYTRRTCLANLIKKVYIANSKYHFQEEIDKLDKQQEENKK